MKLYLLIFLSITLINNVLATDWYQQIDTHRKDFITITASKDCKNIYICTSATDNIYDDDKDTLDNCVDVYDNKVGSRSRKDHFNPFWFCQDRLNIIPSLKLLDCKTSKNGIETVKINEKYNDVIYTTEKNIHDRILTIYGWCKYTNGTGKCGKINGLNCRSGYCCSKHGYCGQGSDYCGKNCDSYYGTCKS
ncbi:hypothetical protein BCR32DRAFT_328484 [Anaeromyces robustus]|uniref:Chitin-binding type-1 domain-containing protein n=1 Tax=Anaeromyces robustus TaxID=1754192 RepID=A0A1Y1WYJ3_9FUNG|nr:hypothetical protein BCR32DRAFT_328484 [Anaeromyces robustus]|eukprot:ORX78573.1 hypothetical protein BCR32DRAFT_328484 [Anaeromyces robustus]